MYFTFVTFTHAVNRSASSVIIDSYCWYKLCHNWEGSGGIKIAKPAAKFTKIGS